VYVRPLQSIYPYARALVVVVVVAIEAVAEVLIYRIYCKQCYYICFMYILYTYVCIARYVSTRHTLALFVYAVTCMCIPCKVYTPGARALVVVVVVVVVVLFWCTCSVYDRLRARVAGQMEAIEAVAEVRIYMNRMYKLSICDAEGGHRVAASTPLPKYLDIFKGAPLRLSTPLSDQFPVRVCSCPLCI